MYNAFSIVYRYKGGSVWKKKYINLKCLILVMLLWSIRLNGTPESLVMRNAKRPQEEYTYFFSHQTIYI